MGRKLRNEGIWKEERFFHYALHEFLEGQAEERVQVEGDYNRHGIAFNKAQIQDNKESNEKIILRSLGSLSIFSEREGEGLSTDGCGQSPCVRDILRA